MIKIPRTELLQQKQHTSKNCLPVVLTYHPTIVCVDKAVIKEWKRHSKIPAAKHVQQHNYMRVEITVQPQANPRQDKNPHYADN